MKRYLATIINAQHPAVQRTRAFRTRRAATRWGRAMLLSTWHADRSLYDLIVRPARYETPMTAAATITDRIAAAEQAQTAYTPAFSPTRFPYTYAYDFMRGNPDQFGAIGSRGEAASALTALVEKTGEDRETAAQALALAYCRQWAIPVPQEILAATSGAGAPWAVTTAEQGQ